MATFSALGNHPGPSSVGELERGSVVTCGYARSPRLWATQGRLACGLRKVAATLWRFSGSMTDLGLAGGLVRPGGYGHVGVRGGRWREGGRWLR